jgi:hypothetical protein
MSVQWATDEAALAHVDVVESEQLVVRLHNRHLVPSLAKRSPCLVILGASLFDLGPFRRDSLDTSFFMQSLKLVDCSHFFWRGEVTGHTPRRDYGIEINADGRQRVSSTLGKFNPVPLASSRANTLTISSTTATTGRMVSIFRTGKAT